MKDNKFFIFLVIAGIAFFFYTNNKETFHKTFNEVFDNKQTSIIRGCKGPGGGTVFHMEEGKAWEVSEWLGKANWEEAKKICKKYRGGGLSDWYLPNKEELKWIYKGVIETDKHAEE